MQPFFSLKSRIGRDGITDRLVVLGFFISCIFSLVNKKRLTPFDFDRLNGIFDLSLTRKVVYIPNILYFVIIPFCVLKIQKNTQYTHSLIFYNLS